MPKPSSLPRWANLANPADIVEPPSGKKDSGWLTGEKPPHSYFNWLLNLLYQWTQYLDGLTSEALTWTAAHIFSAGITVTTAATLATQAAIKGTGNSLAAGVWGVASATGPGVKGTAASDTAVGGSFTNAADDGIALQATVTSPNINQAAVFASATGANIAIIGSASGGGGVGLSLQASSGAQAAIISGETVLQNGHLVVPATTYETKYAAVRTEWAHVPLSTLGSSDYTRFDVTGGGGATPDFAHWSSLATGTLYLGGGDIRVPAGATIDRVELYCTNNDSVSRNLEYSVARTQFDFSGITNNWVVGTGSAAPATFAIAGGGTTGWQVGIVTPSTVDDQPENVNPGGFGGLFNLYIRLPQTTSAGQFKLIACRVRYTYVNIRNSN